MESKIVAFNRIVICILVIISIVVFSLFIIPLTYRKRAKWIDFGLVGAFFVSLILVFKYIAAARAEEADMLREYGEIIGIICVAHLSSFNA